MLLLLNISFLFAQKVISGIVKDESGTVLPEVNILEKGTKNGVSTDFNRIYKITVKDEACLIFSYVEYKSITTVATETKIDVILVENDHQY